jgi:hypothetical protein
MFVPTRKKEKTTLNNQVYHCTTENRIPYGTEHTAREREGEKRRRKEKEKKGRAKEGYRSRYTVHAT